MVDDLEQLFLQRQRKDFYFVQKQRAAMSLRHLAWFTFIDTSKRVFLIAKYFGLQQRVGISGTVNRNKRRASASAMVVNGKSDLFLDRSGFSRDHHRHVDGRSRADQLKNAAHLRRWAQNIAELEATFQPVSKLPCLNARLGVLQSRPCRFEHC